MTKTTYVSTYLGNRFYPLEPRIDKVAIEDIAHGLAFQCRFNGQTCDFYSVAQHSLIVADLVPESHRLAALLHDAESRPYYAAYHAAVALLLTQGLEARSHSGVANLLGLHFVKTGRLDAGDARLFARLQKYRVEADYSTEFVLTAAALEEDLAACHAFILRVRSAIASHGD